MSVPEMTFATGALNMSNYRCLVVEDEAPIRELLALILVREGYQVQTVSTPDQALSWMEQNEYDLMIIDWMLPAMSGVELIKTIRERRVTTPILMVTAKTQPEDIVTGLESGADDYVTKPFDSTVLKARIQALLRRSKAASGGMSGEVALPEELKLGQILLKPAQHEVYVRGEMVHLTPSEFKILQEMLQNIGRVLTREYLMSKVQGEGIIVTGRTIDTHVFALRKKIGDQAEYIETIRGVGYRIRE